nr:hypothetical protein [Fischerella thermalis]
MLSPIAAEKIHQAARFSVWITRSCPSFIPLEDSTWGLPARKVKVVLPAPRNPVITVTGILCI